MSFRFLTLLLAFPVSALAANITISHHARLLDGNDQPVNGMVTMTFAIYTALADTPGEAPEPPIWTEEYLVEVVQGALALDLGSPADGKRTLDSSLFVEHPSLFLEVAVNGAPMSPRMRFSSIPLSALADHAKTAGHAETATLAEHATTAGLPKAPNRRRSRRWRRTWTAPAASAPRTSTRRSRSAR